MVEKLSHLGIAQVQDLLFHLPRQYHDKSRIVPMAKLQLGKFCQVEGRVQSSQVNFGKRRSLLVTLEDDHARLTLRFFHFSKAQQQQFQQGRLVRCFAEVRQGPRGPEMVHPEYQFDPAPLNASDNVLTPVYPSTEGVSQKQWLKLQQQVQAILRQSDVQLALTALPDDATFLDCDISQALLFLHQPPNTASLETIEKGKLKFQQRLAFEELLAHQISLLRVRHKRQKDAAPVFKKDVLAKQLLAHLSFTLTGAQKRSFNEIRQDCLNNYPMLRLVQGDVGSGKTVVAALGAALAVASGYQVAIMAPTEILAEQHWLSFREWFAPLKVQTDALMGRHTAKQKREIISRLENGETDIVLATHAIFQDPVAFNNLGLVIIDEQHRFGVHQRLALRNKGAKNGLAPHQLIMTATPIPRTLAMTAYADLDLSLIDELPPGRKPITTIAIEQQRRAEVIERLHHVCSQGQQAYWVCTLIEESETLNCQAAEDAALLLQQLLPDLRVGLVHGRLKNQEKADIMAAFTQGDIDLLVATTVIEVGVNVPNASLMVIENPERLGLAQLHQLRGRIGRGSLESFCLLLYQHPLSQNAKKRIGIMRETNDGFKIAETDLQLRGPGEVLGKKQTGDLQFRIADIERDQDLLPIVSRYSKALMAQNFDANALIKRWIIKGDYYSNA